jgi:multiple antibiotic resistance protein
MIDLLKTLLLAWIPLFVALDPVGVVPIFLGMTAGIDHDHRRRIMHQAVWTAAIVAVGFMFLGRLIFKAVGISVGDFKVAGGLILLVLASRHLLQTGPSVTPLPEDFGIVPLGLPLIAGPATLTTLLILTDSVGIRFTLAALVVNLCLVSLALHFSDRLAQWIGANGLNAISKIISLLLAAIAVSMIRRGWQTM